MFKNPPSNAGDAGSITGWETDPTGLGATKPSSRRKNPCAAAKTQHGQIKKKHLCIFRGFSCSLSGNKRVSKVAQLCPTLCDPMDCRLLCPWDFPGKNTEVDCHFLL